MHSFTIHEFAYCPDLIKQYRLFSDMPGFVLLESIDQTRGRYDLLSAYPYTKVTLPVNEQKAAVVYDDLFKKIPTYDFGLDLPFQGGAIGYFSYDLACLLAGLHVTSQPELNTMPLLAVGLYDWAIITDHQLKKVTLFAANRQPETAQIIEMVKKKWQQETANKASFILTQPFAPLISKAAYAESFHAIHQDLQHGRCYQVNYTQPFKTYYSGEPWAVYETIRNKNPVPYAAFLRDDSADILSFSPERFIKMENKLLLTSPIKGSERRVQDSQADNQLKLKLQQSEKNLAENIMIVDLMRNDLGKIAVPGTVNVEHLCQVQSYQAVHHLVSDISAVCLPHINPLQAFSACFPGGSITGAPKLEAMKVIAEQEPYARNLYCGSIGYFSAHGRFDTNIAIRTIMATEETLHLSAGGGIVIDSNCEEEYQECLIKIAAIVRAMGK